MKIAMLMGFLFLMFSAKAQETFNLLSDSLTNRASRSWQPCNDTSLNQTAGNCFRGTVYTFHRKNNAGTKAKCVNGRWVSSRFTWTIKREDNREIVRVTKEGEADEKFSIQLVSHANVIRPRLTQVDYHVKNVERFCF